MENVYVWNARRRYGGGKVDAIIYKPGEDLDVFSLKLTGAPGKLVDDIVSALNGAYNRGLELGGGTGGSVDPLELKQALDDAREEGRAQGRAEAEEEFESSESKRNTKLKSEVQKLQARIEELTDKED